MEFFIVLNVSFDNVSLVSDLQGVVKTEPEQQHSTTESFAFTRSIWKYSIRQDANRHFIKYKTTSTVEFTKFLNRNLFMGIPAECFLIWELFSVGLTAMNIQH